MTWILIILGALFLDRTCGKKKKKYGSYNPKKHKKASWYNEKEWLDAAWFHDHNQRI